MKASDIIALFRDEADDEAQPFRWDDPVLLKHLDEADREASRRSLFLSEAQDPQVCRYPVAIGQKFVKLHWSVIKVTKAWLEYKDDEGNVRIEELSLEKTYDLDRDDPGWRTEKGAPTRACTDAQTQSLRLVGETTVKTTLGIECKRMPLKRIENLNDCPETPERYQTDLVQWLVMRAFKKKDADTYDKSKAEAAELRFAQVFGPPVSTDDEVGIGNVGNLRHSRARFF